MGTSTDGLFIYNNNITCIYTCKCENARNKYYLQWVGCHFPNFQVERFPIFYCKSSFARRAMIPPPWTLRSNDGKENIDISFEGGDNTTDISFETKL